jgi:hypothetical protein
MSGVQVVAGSAAGSGESLGYKKIPWMICGSMSTIGTLRSLSGKDLLAMGPWGPPCLRWRGRTNLVSSDEERFLKFLCCDYSATDWRQLTLSQFRCSHELTVQRLDGCTPAGRMVLANSLSALSCIWKSILTPALRQLSRRCLISWYPLPQEQSCVMMLS